MYSGIFLLPENFQRSLICRPHIVQYDMPSNIRGGFLLYLKQFQCLSFGGILIDIISYKHTDGPGVAASESFFSSSLKVIDWIFL